MREIDRSIPLATYELATSGAPVQGQLCALSNGKLIAASDTASQNVLGVVRQIIGNYAEVFEGVFAFANGTSGAALARADRGAVALVVDAGTVGKTSTNKVVAGLVVDVYDDEVWVDCRLSAIAAAKAQLVAAAALAAAQ